MSRAAAGLVVLAGLAGAAYWRWGRDEATPRPAPTQRPDAGGLADAAVVDDAAARPVHPPPLGDTLAMRLLAPAATSYSTRRAADVTADEVRLLDAHALRLGVPLRADAALAQAAREVAVQAARLGELPPEVALTRLLHTSGAPDVGASAYLTQADADDGRALALTLDAALAQAPPGRGPIRVGVGEVATDGRLGRTIVALVAQLEVELDGVPSVAAPSARWTARLTPAPGWDGLHALALGPRGEQPSVTVTRAGADVVLEVDLPGGVDGDAIAIGVDGDGPAGPGKLMQLTVWLGDAAPAWHEVALAAEDPPGLDEAGATARAFELLNADRARHGVAPLARDAALDAIARGHSADMRDGGFFGHRSPRTGVAGDRLAAAGYWAQAYGENLARNDSIAEAEASLLASLGHRANLIDPRFTVVGVGVAMGEAGWYLTQLFARPTTRLAADAARALAARIDAARRDVGNPPLPWRPALAQAAQAAAARLGALTVEDVTAHASDAARAHLRGGGAVWVATGVDVEAGELPVAALADGATGVGLGLWQDPADGTVGLVVIVEGS